MPVNASLTCLAQLLQVMFSAVSRQEHIDEHAMYHPRNKMKDRGTEGQRDRGTEGQRELSG